MYLFCISCKLIVATIKVPTLVIVYFGYAVAGFQMSADSTVSHSVTEKGVKQRMKPLPTFFVSVKLWLHIDMCIRAPTCWSQRALRG